MEQTAMTTLQDLEQKLKSHDWYSEYSDDYRAWKAGWDSALQIRMMINQLGNIGLRDEAEALYKQYRPKVEV
jgi:hypothetical protein